MKANTKFLLSLSGVATLSLVAGCSTTDARDFPPDSGPVGASNQCGAMAAARCFVTQVIPKSGEFLDFGLLNAGPPPSCSQTFSVSFGSDSTGPWIHPGPDLDAGVPWYSDAGNPNGVSFLPAADGTCHLKGTIPGAGSWGIYMNPPTSDPCTDKSQMGGLVDASAFDGLTITVGGNAGPPRTNKINIFSVGTPEDPYREQKLTVEISIEPVPRTYRFHWKEMVATCGRHEWFNPATIINIGGEMLALNGIAYDYDVLFGKIGFFKDP